MTLLFLCLGVSFTSDGGWGEVTPPSLPKINLVEPSTTLLVIVDGVHEEEEGVY